MKSACTYVLAIGMGCMNLVTVTLQGIAGILKQTACRKVAPPRFLQGEGGQPPPTPALCKAPNDGRGSCSEVVL